MKRDDALKIDPYDLRDKADVFHGRNVSVSIREDNKGRFLCIDDGYVTAKVYEEL